MMALRVMYMVAVDILVAPIVALMVIVNAVNHKHPMHAYLEGLKLAMAEQLKWVKYGEN